MNHKPEHLEQATPLQRAVLALKEVRAQFEAHKDAQFEPLAIVGIGCRFPGGANSPEAYWQLLRNGVDAITEVPPQRWNTAELYDANVDAPGKISTRHGGFVDDVDQFEPQFFGISPREAANMDPQQRLFLEVAWEALENAGYAPERLRNSKTGVFAGATMSDYLHLAKQQPVEKIDTYFLTGNCLNVIAGRISFFLGLHGPSLVVDTACSSSLSAIHLACQSLRSNECELALAGGVNVMLVPEMIMAGSRAHMFAADGRCKTFDARADGFVRGEGCGIVVLKRWSAAIKSGDRIFAVIKGSAMNQDGPSSGLTVPNSEAQKMLLRAALQNARVTPQQIQYVEAHGTGTALGDPIEVRALGEVLREGRAPEHTLLLGSAKTNLGHLESAAGVAGLIKTALALHHGEVPPHLHFQTINPDIALADCNARIATERMPWPAWGEARLAGVSAFGMSGTNVHVILQGALVASDQLSVISDQLPVNRESLPLNTDHWSLMTEQKDRTAHLLTLSARDENALKQLAEKYEEHFATHQDLNLAHACYTANTGRAQFRHRVAVVAQSLAQAQSRLKDFLVDKEAPGLLHGNAKSGAKKSLAFLYAGQGYQYLGMGRVLYDTQPTFRKALLQCDELFLPYLKTSLLEVLYPELSNTSLKAGIAPSSAQRTTSNEQPATSNQKPATPLLDQTFYTQPAMFALQYALTQLWLSWGFVPTVVMGHSLGEFMAAQLAGVYSLEDAVKLVAERGRLTDDVPAVGMMASVQASEATVRDALAMYGERVTMAAINGPDSVVITGLKAEVQEVLARFEREGVNVRRLAISNAFHSQFIDPALDRFSRVAAEVTYHQPKLPLVSTLTGELLRFDLQTHDSRFSILDHQSTSHDPRSYWRRHLREPVQFYAAMRTLHAMGIENFLEIGPNPTQLGMGRRCLPEGYGNWFPSLRQGRDDWQQMLESVGAMYVSGMEVDWPRFEQDYARRRVTLPTYPFQRKTYWVEKPRATHTRNDASTACGNPLLARCTQSPLIKETIFETQLSAERFPFLSDHKIHDMLVFPLTGYLEIIWAAARHAFGEAVAGVEELVMHEPLLVPETESVAVQLVFKPEEQHTLSLQVLSLAPQANAKERTHKTHVSATLKLGTDAPPITRDTLESLRARCNEAVAVDALYHNLAERGLQFGPGFQGAEQVWRGANEALGKIVLPEGLHDEAANYHAHPALLDACLQVFAAAWPRAEQEQGTATFLPLRVEHFRVQQRLGAEVWSHVRVREQAVGNTETYLGEVTVYVDGGAPVAELRGLLLKRTSAETLRNILQPNLAEWFYETAWRKQPLVAPKISLTATQPLLATLRAEKDLAAYEELLPQLDQLSAAYVARALQQLGGALAPAQSFTTASLALQLGILPKYQRLLARMLAMLAEEDILQREGETWSVKRAPATAPLAAWAAALLQKYPASATELQLTRMCGEALAPVLTGRQDPLQLLFPNGSVEFLERLYQHSPLTQAMNRLAARALATALEALPRERKLRVLEIGAGTGGTTAYVLPLLRAHQVEYVFTDVSPVFLAQAREKFRAYDFVQYQTLDIERAPAAQNFSMHEFDIVIATNALHATADLRQALRHAHALLRSGGMLLLIEGTAPERWVDLTFGLTDGWWRFTDTDLRRTSPLIGKAEWHKALAACAFADVEILPTAETESNYGRAFEQHALVLARAQAQVEDDAPWLVFAEENRLSAALQTRLRAQGQRIIVVRPGSAFAQLEANTFTLAPERAEDFARLLQEALHEGECAGVIYLWATELTLHDGLSLEALQQAHHKSGAAVLHLAQALIKANLPSMPRLWLVTRHAQNVAAQVAPTNAVQTSLWGLAKTISLEHPELHCTRIDVDDEVDASAKNIFEEVWRRDREAMVAYRNDERYLARLVHSEKSVDSRSKIVDREEKVFAHDPRSTIRDLQSLPAQQLILSTPGALDSLQYAPSTRRAPRAHEVEIFVHAVGLNFRDVLNALGLYPGDAGALGGDCSGVVVAVGEGVTDIRVGDEVFAVAAGSFATYVVTHADLVVPKPKTLRHAQACTIPSAFLTAHYALITLGKLQHGERVLLHSATGGVGLAAVQIAQRAGAEIFATAGNAEKRAYLRSLGITQVFDSRTTNFTQEILAATHGAGVDVVLNSLTGDLIPASQDALHAQGRFLEIGKRGIWSPEQFAARKPQASYHVIDLAELVFEKTALIKTLFAELRSDFERETLHALPLESFTATEVVAAFRRMQSAKHIGKIVVEQVGEESRAKLEDSGSRMVDRSSPWAMHNPQSTINDPQSTILITGGLAGLGLLTAQWLVAQGARHLALLARRAPSEAARAAIAEMQNRGAQIFVAQGDVAEAAELQRILAEVRKTLPPLRGIIHSAGVLDDGALLQQNWSRFETVLAPKVRGAWLLHQLTQDDPIALFVLYSSMVSLLGARGQGNHAMANAFLDGLAHYRRQRGQAAMSIHWGAWSEIGAAAERKVDTRVSTQGAGAIAPQQGLQALAQLLQRNPNEVGVMPVDWRKYTEQFSENVLPFFTEVRAHAPRPSVNKPASKTSKPQPKILEQLQNAPAHLRKPLLLGYVKEQALRVLGLEANAPLDQEEPLQKLGLDSLMSVELRNVLGAGLGLKRALPATLLFDYPTVIAVTDYLARDVLAWENAAEHKNGNTAASSPPAEVHSAQPASLSELSEQEAEALLLAELERK